MNIIARQSLTLDQFLAWEECQELKYEFDGLEPRAMTGGTAAHARIQVNLAVALTSRLRGTACRFFNNDLKILVAGSVRYPDGFVSCTPLAPEATMVPDPVVIFEVLSPSTAKIDSGVKNREYEATPSVKRYVMLEQDEMAGTEFERVGSDWVGHILRADAILRMPEIGIEVPLAELYEGALSLPNAPTPTP